MPRILLVSNRLPVTLERGPTGVLSRPSSGGLATGLSGPHRRLAGRWIGWPGITYREPAERAAADQALDEQRLDGVWLEESEIQGFYEGISNGVLWPLLHSLPDALPLQPLGWEVYRAVNERFADRVVARYRPGDLIWVHDYHLALVPALIRRRLPSARIGFFLHIPFPSPETFAALPWAREFLAGLKAADLVGFHTEPYRQNYLASARTGQLGSGPEFSQTGVFPMGVDEAAWRRLAEDRDVLRAAAEIRAKAGGRAILLGVDRLDYTKGIPRRLLAIEALLERRPDLADRVRLVQVSVPSRESVPRYGEMRGTVDELIGRINGRFGTTESVPIHPISRRMSECELAAIYIAAEVMLVTPLRDGMNLVAKEYVATRVDSEGVLILSEFAGAHQQMPEALSVNPYDIEETSRAIERALTMPTAERRQRMAALRTGVACDNVHAWASSFLTALAGSPRPCDRPMSGLHGTPLERRDAWASVCQTTLTPSRSESRP